MPIIPPNNTTGLYGVDTTVSINNNIYGNNMVLTGNAVVGGTISAAGNITTGGFFVGNFEGNISGNIVAAGSNTQVQYNDDGFLGAESTFTYNAATNTLSVPAVTTGLVRNDGNANVIVRNLAAVNDLNGNGVYIDSNNVFVGNIGNRARFNAAPSTDLQIVGAGGGPEITFVQRGGSGIFGNTGNLDVRSTSTSGGGGFIATGNINLAGNVYIGQYGTQVVAGTYGNLQVDGNIRSSSNISAVGNITGNYFLGNGSALTGITATALPAGANTEIQYNNNGALGADSDFTFNAATNTLAVPTITATGNITGGNVIGTYLWGDGSNITGVVAGSSSTRIAIKNTSASSIAKGTPVYATGTVGASTIVEVAASRADTDSTMPCIGLADATLAVNDQGYAISVGTLTGVNTAAFATGDLLYVAAAGGLTTARPTGTDTVQLIGVVGRVNAGSGSIETNIWSEYGLPNLANGNIWLGNAAAYPTSTSLTTVLSTYTGNLSGGNINTTGLVSATGNISSGAYFLGDGSQLTNLPTTTPGGSNTQVQFNNSGAFGGDNLFTWNTANAQAQVGNIYITANNTNIQSVNAINLSATPGPQRITIGSGYNGNYGANIDPLVIGRGGTLAVIDKYNIGNSDTNMAQRMTTSTLYADMGGATLTNNARRLQPLQGVLYLGNGTQQVTGGPVYATATGIGGVVNVGNIQIGTTTLDMGGTATVSHVAGAQMAVGVGANGTVGNAVGVLSRLQALTNATSTTNTAIGFVPEFVSAFTSTTAPTNVYGMYMAGTTSTHGISNANNWRRASNYYFLMNEDDVAQNRLGSLRRYHEFNGVSGTTSGSLTIDKTNGQVQQVNLTGNVTLDGFSNFVTSASDSVNTDEQCDTVTIIFNQGSTGGYDVTFPTGSTYRYAGNVTALQSTAANTVSLVSVSAIRISSTTTYLITISPEFV